MWQMRVGNLLNLGQSLFLVTVLPKWFCFLLSPILKCTALYILVFVCDLVGLFKKGHSLLAF